MKILVMSYVLRFSPSILGLLGVVFNSFTIFYIGGIICIALHIIFFLRETLKPITIIILISLVAFLTSMNFIGIMWGALISTLFEMLYHGIKTYRSLHNLIR